MSQRIYNLIYAIYFWRFGPNEDYEDAEPKEFEKYAIEMLEEIQDDNSKTEVKK